MPFYVPEADASEAEKPLPDKIRVLLFADKRKVDLIWNDKRNKVNNIFLPFQVIEQVVKHRAEKDTLLQRSMLKLDARGMLIWVLVQTGAALD
jgi:hypothetical protein